MKDLHTENETLMKAAVAQARQIGKALATRVATDFNKDAYPISVFMAGSPGAGKTESAKRLIEQWGDVLHIDPDAYRPLIDGYAGSNSHLFNRAVTIIAEKLHDAALKSGINFIFDSTMSDSSKAISNIERSLRYSRKVIVLYVYQEPGTAWSFVRKREERDGRRISKKVFIEKFLAARDSVREVKEKFGDRVRLDVLVKEISNDSNEYHTDTNDVDSLIARTYTKSILEAEI